MQPEQFASREELIPTLASFDEEFGREEVAPAAEGERRGRLLHSIGHLLGCAVLGIVLAVTWRNFDRQLWSDMRFWPGFGAQSTPGASNPESAEQFTRLVRELETLNKEVGELRVAQQQAAASIAALQVGQQELRSFQAASWYSNPAVLMFRIATMQEGKQTPTVRARSETRDANVGRRNESAPLQLGSPQP